MKRTALVLVFLTSFGFSSAQSTHDVILSGEQDLIKSDIKKLFDRAQFGVEANYFVVRHFAVGLGAELWTHHATEVYRQNSFVMGARWYANEMFFVRLRGLIGANDASLGAGLALPITKVWRIEAIGDFYFRDNFALRAGITYVIKR